MSRGSVWKRPHTQFLDPSVGLRVVLTCYPCSMLIIPIPLVFPVSVRYFIIGLTQPRPLLMDA